MFLLSIVGFVLVTSLAGFNIIIAYDKRDDLSGIETSGLSYLFGIGAISIEMFLFGLLDIKFTTSYILMPWIFFIDDNPYSPAI